ncbi:MAG: HlyD family efflux transporter periplasmic adaptor subunit [Nitrospirae bacterium]|nr:HlyD family efflux transporter periplasmic adaptor subunit [Nitrospirota bacterium]MCL5285640.1 HlyD family efflux transporter periplasmic adaptor subunit [Nitrospirota bacterium]
MAETSEKGPSFRSWRILVPVAGLVGTLLWGGYILADRARYVRSVDCYVQGKITLIASPVGGRLLDLKVNEGDPVQFGEVIATVDTTGDRYNRRHDTGGNLTPYQTLERDLDRKVRIEREVADARDHYHRGRDLLKNRFISAQDLEDLETTYRKKEDQLREIRRLIRADRQMLSISEVHPRNRTVFASISGQVAQRLVNLGETVRPNQPLVSIIDTRNRDNIWLDAYLRETQVWKVHPGQKVRIRIDAFPNLRFEGRVLEFIPAASQAFSLLPTQNAAGTFVKVVQRIPVRIVFDDLKGQAIFPGMSAEVAIVRKS